MKKRFVLDCSITMCWCFEDEASSKTDAVLDSLPKSESFVPSIWSLEVVNVLLIAERQKRLKEAEVTRFISLLQSLPIIMDEETTRRSFVEIRSLAREYQLSSYDAAYLELAMRKGIGIASKDSNIIKAARQIGVDLVI